MPCWYQAFCCKGDPQKILTMIADRVHQHNLTQFVPVVRLEKKMQQKKRGRASTEFYLFIAIESDKVSQVPPAVQLNLFNLLQQMSFVKWQVPKGLEYEEIKKMAGAGFDVYDFTRPIPYHPTEDITNENPFDWTETSFSEQPDTDAAVLSFRHERFLYWLSALGNGTWESFKKACQVLKLSEPKQILRRLKLLGHIESSLDGSRWSSSPTALVRVGGKTDCLEFLLCGQQSENLLKKLEQYITITRSNRQKGDAPPRMSLQLDSLEELSHIIDLVRSQLGITITNAGDASWRLAQVLPELMTWKQGLRSLQGIVPSLYEWKRFNRDEFVECIFRQQTGMYEMWDTSGRDRPLRTLFYDSETQTWRQGDWYGLRFLALHHSNQQCIARYDSATARLAIPFCQRWPELYERALVLASGLLPSYQRTEQSLWLIYENVGLNLAYQLTKKLYITCEEATTDA